MFWISQDICWKMIGHDSWMFVEAAWKISKTIAIYCFMLWWSFLADAWKLVRWLFDELFVILWLIFSVRKIPGLLLLGWVNRVMWEVKYQHLWLQQELFLFFFTPRRHIMVILGWLIKKIVFYFSLTQERQKRLFGRSTSHSKSTKLNHDICAKLLPCVPALHVAAC